MSEVSDHKFFCVKHRYHSVLKSVCPGCEDEVDYWKRRYEIARDVAIEQASLNIITTIGNQKMMKDVDAEIERRLSEMSHKGDK